MKRETIGILAHVDSGKTTLCEAMLYTTGNIRKAGRVDHKNTFLDTHEIEKNRGITIFSKQAILNYGNTSFTLLDTPGHIDFSPEAERTMQVLDYAILVISGADGVQSHTETLWKLLKRYRVPVFLFVNKMDLEVSDRATLMSDLKAKLDEGCVNFEQSDPTGFLEEVALCSSELMQTYLDSGTIGDSDIADAIASRLVFPCYFGSALKFTGIEPFLAGIDRYTKSPLFSDEFGAKVFKISDDGHGGRLTHLKITGGSLKVRDQIGDEKVTQIRIYSGTKFQPVEVALPGTVCAVLGLANTYPGLGVGAEGNSAKAQLESVMTYRVLVESDTDLHTALSNLRQLEQEEPQLHILWNERYQEIHVQIMGEVQLEVLRQIARSRFDMEIAFDRGSIAYKETIAKPIMGVGHYEPLRHYAEVHLLLEPGKRGSGIQIASRCLEDDLEKNWQNLILTHLREKTHLGVLTGSPITDIKITLIAGRAHKKHTEGGDFRQATYRAVRQGLKMAESVLLEPWYDFRLEVPLDAIGRAMTDIQNMGGKFSPPKTKGEYSILIGSAPVKAMQDYSVVDYTHGKGRLTYSLKGYEVCTEADEIVAQIGYDSDSDTDNPADSIFCSHGSGVIVKWNEAPQHMHVQTKIDPEEELEEAVTEQRIRRHMGHIASDQELLRIFEMTYGPLKTPPLSAMRRDKRAEFAESAKNLPKARALPEGPEYLLVDGYNIIFAWEDLSKLAEQSLDLARSRLVHILCNYQAFHQCRLILVFDAYKVKRYDHTVERVHNIDVVYTKEAETADMYIEKVTKQLAKNHRVRVATSDRLEQLIILGGGAQRIGADTFLEEVRVVEKAIRSYLERDL